MSYTVSIFITSMDGKEREAVLSEALSDTTRHEFKRDFESYGWNSLTFDSPEEAYNYVAERRHVMPELRNMKALPPLFSYWKEGTEDYEILFPCFESFKTPGQLCLFATIKWHQ